MPARKKSVSSRRRNGAIGLSRRDLSFVFYSSPDPISISTLADGRFIEVNDAFVQVFGYAREELIGRTSVEIGLWMNPEDRGGLAGLMRGQGEVINVEVAFRTRGGSLLPAYVSVRCIELDGQQCVVALIGDISRHKEAQEALRRSEHYLRSIIDNFPYLVWLKDPQGRYLAVNKVFARACGYETAEEIIGRTDLDLWPRGQAEAYRADDLAIMAGRGKSIVEEPRVHGGEPRWFETFKAPAVGAGGSVIGTTGFSHDITERKHAEMQLRLAAQVFSRAAESIVITDANANILSVNRAFTEMTGYSPQEVIGKNPRLLKSGRQDCALYAAMWESIRCTGRWQGEVWNRRKNGEVYPQWLSITAVTGTGTDVENYIGIATDISERKAAQERIHYLAHYDVLTDLPNRALLQDRIEQALAGAERYHNELAILFLDLDRFKNINDSLGHHVGDLVLKAVAGRLKHCLREVDTVARHGGDGFVIVLADSGVDRAAHVAEKLLEVLGESYLIEEHTLRVTPSIGISIFPHDGRDAGTLIKNADAALYFAKGQGRNNYQFFTERMNVAAFERLSLEGGLRLALERREFVLYYQPQVDVASGRIVGAEALLRWRHPTMGVIMPGRFIPVAEDSGLIISIGEWIVEEGCRQCAEWQRRGLAAIPVAVNLSPIQLRQKDFAAMVRRILAVTGLPGEYLELELTESAIMHDEEAVIAVLRELDTLGVRLAIDDFGTGYSSLSRLKRFPIHRLKIDQSFVQQCPSAVEDAAIVRAVISLAHSLDRKVIAEGVESPEQLAFLSGEGCDEMQGYHLGMPMPAGEFARLLAGGVPD